MKRTSSSGSLNANKRRRQIDPNEGKELGKIESITMRNFMCHDNFEFRFGPRMNFIIGQNGSGKSAILTGLILALGGKSKVTGRFSNIKGFIKTGKQRAKIEVVLHNNGDCAFKPELYGKKICVSREFSVDGANSYKLKTEAGKIVASHKDELNSILTCMDIQIDNPVQVLTQETSRSFLLSKHAKGEKLYEFFFKGTGLQKLEDDYQNILKMKTDGADDLKRKQQVIPEMKNELKRWQKFLESSAKIKDYKNELLWAGVIEMEKLLEKKQKECAKLENELKINKEEMEKCKGVLDSKVEELDEYQKKKNECVSILTECKNKLKLLNDDREKFTMTLQKHRGSLDLCKREEKKISNEIQNLENRINENIQKTQIDVKEEEGRRWAKIEQLQNDNQYIASAWESLGKKESLLMEEQNQMRQKLDNLVAEINRLEWGQKKIGEQIERSKMASQNKVNVFGNNTQQVLNEISVRKGEFRKLPRGPIGMYLEVKDPRWSPAIEKCISKGLLCSYCVDNHQDDHTLKDILRRHCRQMPSTIVCPYSDHMYDVSQHKAQTNYPTVLDMLDIKDIQVANALIDQAKIENKILIEDTRTGQNLMMSNPPRNCYAAYIMNCDQICLEPYRYYSESNPNKSSLLSSIRQDEIEQLKQELQKCSLECNIKNKEKHELENSIVLIPAEVKKLHDQIVQLSSRKKQNLEKIKDLDCVNETEDVNCLQVDLQSLQQEQERKVAEIEEYKLIVAKYDAERNRIVSEMDSVKNLLIEKKEKFDELGEKINQVSQEKETLSLGKNRFENEVKVVEKQLQTLQAQLDVEKQKTEEATQNATKVCKRIETERSVDDIRRQLAETEKVVEEQSNCDKNELHNKFREKAKVLREAEQDLKRIEGYILKIHDMLRKRISRFKNIRHHTRNIIDYTFISILDGNGYTGSLKFDDTNRTLKLEVAPKRDQSARQNHSILSGGERSFVTISFLLSLWERTNMPFRILDEYDVFMDSNNRQLSVELLIRKANDMEKTQFIFLSPLDLPLIESANSNNIKIHRMVPPKRNDVEDASES